MFLLYVSCWRGVYFLKPPDLWVPSLFLGGFIFFWFGILMRRGSPYRAGIKVFENYVKQT